jgi:hypothetical protein
MKFTFEQKPPSSFDLDAREEATARMIISKEISRYIAKRNETTNQPSKIAYTMIIDSLNKIS